MAAFAGPARGRPSQPPAVVLLPRASRRPPAAAPRSRRQPGRLIAFHDPWRDLHDELLPEVVGDVPERIGRERRRFVLRRVFDQESVRCFLDRLPALYAGFLLDDLAVALLQALALAAFLPDGLVPIRRAGGPTAPPPVQDELVMVEPAVLEDAHRIGFIGFTSPIGPRHHSSLQWLATVKAQIGAAGHDRAWVDYRALRRRRRRAGIPERP